MFLSSTIQERVPPPDDDELDEDDELLEEEELDDELELELLEEDGQSVEPKQMLWFVGQHPFTQQFTPHCTKAHVCAGNGGGGQLTVSAAISEAERA